MNNYDRVLLGVSRRVVPGPVSGPGPRSLYDDSLASSKGLTTRLIHQVDQVERRELLSC